MSIALTQYDGGELCHGCTWAIADIDALANEIARVAVGQADHIAEILVRAGLSAPKTTEHAIKDAIALVTAKGDPYHRDGWLMQVMSWIAAHRDEPGGLIRAPHMLLAHKGFDGVQIQFAGNGNAVTGVVIFEDKATENPRSTIRDEVWPEFRELEQGKKQNVLAAEVSGLLKSHSSVDANKALESIIWAQSRKYRVAITVEGTHSTDAGRARLFKQFDEVAPGDKQRRRAETFLMPQMRVWMESLAQLTIDKLNKLAPSHV